MAALHAITRKQDFVKHCKFWRSEVQCCFFFCNKTEHFKAGINKTDLFTCNLWKCSAKFAVKLHFPNLHACWSFGERCKIRRRSLFLRVMNEYIHEKQIKPHDCESEMFILFHFAFAKGATINPVARVNAYIWNSKSFRSHTDSYLRNSWLYDVRSEMHRNMNKKKTLTRPRSQNKIDRPSRRGLVSSPKWIIFAFSFSTLWVGRVDPSGQLLLSRF